MTTSTTISTATESTITPNRYPGTCTVCLKRVEAALPNRSLHQGQAYRSKGRWLVRHLACVRPDGVEVSTSARSAERSEVGARSMGKAPTSSRPTTRPTWAEVLEANEFFDGEPEVTAEAKARWLDGGYDR